MLLLLIGRIGRLGVRLGQDLHPLAGVQRAAQSLATMLILQSGQPLLLVIDVIEVAVTFDVTGGIVGFHDNHCRDANTRRAIQRSEKI